MKKIFVSLSVVLGLVVIVSGATYAYFSSIATVADNTFATGTLDVRVNGQPTIAGFTFDNAAPGDVVEKTFSLQNYGDPYFPGDSTLDAKRIIVGNSMTAGDADLYGALDIKLYANAGWSGCSNPGVNFVPGKGCAVYEGPLSGLTSSDVLHATQWGADPTLIPGNSLSMTMDVSLPDTGTDQNDLQGQTTTFDLILNAFNP